ncbi:hypothetical protein KI688_009143 [Linnemannia hyalina]|uniref:Uncharacterized protein n=1 Tax=Linnemannia hyalina TaxID=64524 RepID=A0A9P8BW17_9FUNG|nr:hypothetical protein KI688_009143 [Linnemannia hyalina]
MTGCHLSLVRHPFAAISMTDGLYSVTFSGAGASGATAISVDLTEPVEALLMANEESEHFAKGVP